MRKIIFVDNITSGNSYKFVQNTWSGISDI